MKKVLRFEIKQNLHRPARIYVKSPDLKSSYGYFHADNPSSFDGWDKLSPEQTIELKLFIQNIDAINTLLDKDASSNLVDFRFRLPIDFVAAINELGSLLVQEGVEFNLFESAITGIIQQLKIATTKLKDKEKHNALTILDKIGLAEYKKLDFTQQKQAVFAELLAIHDKSEKLHHKALHLFNKDKKFSPLAIAGMATGDSGMIPSNWLVACAIEILLDEKLSILKTVLSDNDIFVLWAKPLLDNGFEPNELLAKIKKIKLFGIEHGVKNYSQALDIKNSTSNEL